MAPNAHIGSLYPLSTLRTAWILLKTQSRCCLEINLLYFMSGETGSQQQQPQLALRIRRLNQYTSTLTSVQYCFTLWKTVPPLSDEDRCMAGHGLRCTRQQYLSPGVCVGPLALYIPNTITKQNFPICLIQSIRRVVEQIIW